METQSYIILSSSSMMRNTDVLCQHCPEAARKQWIQVLLQFLNIRSAEDTKPQVKGQRVTSQSPLHLVLKCPSEETLVSPADDHRCLKDMLKFLPQRKKCELL